MFLIVKRVSGMRLISLLTNGIEEYCSYSRYNGNIEIIIISIIINILIDIIIAGIIMLDIVGTVVMLINKNLNNQYSSVLRKIYEELWAFRRNSINVWFTSSCIMGGKSLWVSSGLSVRIILSVSVLWFYFQVLMNWMGCFNVPP